MIGWKLSFLGLYHLLCLKDHFSYTLEKTILVCSLFLFSLKEWIGFFIIACSLVFYFMYSRWHSEGPFWKVNKSCSFKKSFSSSKTLKTIVAIIEKEEIENCYWCVICCICILKEILHCSSRLIWKTFSLPYIGFIEQKVIYFILILALLGQSHTT